VSNEINKVIYSMIRVSKHYDKKPVLKDISLSYFYGAKIGVLGLNGSGKTSLLRILAGVDQNFNGVFDLYDGLVPIENGCDIAFSNFFDRASVFSNMEGQYALALNTFDIPVSFNPEALTIYFHDDVVDIDTNVTIKLKDTLSTLGVEIDGIERDKLYRVVLEPGAMTCATGLESTQHFDITVMLKGY